MGSLKVEKATKTAVCADKMSTSVEVNADLKVQVTIIAHFSLSGKVDMIL